MRRLTPPTMAILTAVFLLAGCAPAEEGAGDTQAEAASVGMDRQAAEALVEDFDRAMNAGDVDALMATFSDGPVSLPPNAPPVVGRDAVRAFWASFLGQGDLEVDNVLVEFHSRGDLTVARGTYELTITPAEGAPIQDDGKWVAWWQRGADGAWRTLGNAWSSNNPPAGETG